MSRNYLRPLRASHSHLRIPKVIPRSTSRDFHEYTRINMSSSNDEQNTATGSATEDRTSWKPISYRVVEDAEPLYRYQPGGHRPLMIGDSLSKRYEVVQNWASDLTQRYGSRATWTQTTPYLSKFAPRTGNTRKRAKSSRCFTVTLTLIIQGRRSSYRLSTHSRSQDPMVCITASSQMQPESAFQKLERLLSSECFNSPPREL